MSITLSSADLENLTRAIYLLVSPLDHESVDTWRSAVNSNLRDLLGADSAGFLLPVDNGLAMYSDEHDPKALSAFPDMQPPLLPDGRTVWEEGVRSGVTSLEKMYGPGYDRFRRSAYYNEYAAVNGAHDTVGATTPWGDVAADAVASLHFWHARPVGRLFGEREMSLLRLLFPAFRAGVGLQVRWDKQRTDLLRSIDALGQAVVVYDHSGRTLHQTPALTAMLARDVESSALNWELQAAMNAARGAAAPPARATVPAFGCTREVRTPSARYIVRSCVYGGPPAGSDSYVLVAVERLTPTRRPDSELREAFRLTRAEIRVAVLLSEGKQNVEIAQELGVTDHTARRHTERILQKMGIHSRAQVAVRMYA